MGRPAEALGPFQHAVRLKPDYALAFDGLGWTLNALGRHAEALEACQTAIRFVPKFPDAHYNLGMAYLGLGNREMALRQHQILLSLKSDKAGLLYGNIMGRFSSSLGTVSSPSTLPWPSGLPGGSPAPAVKSDDLYQVVWNYHDHVQKKQVNEALSMYAAAKLPVIKRHLIEAVAKDTEYYRLDHFTTLAKDDSRAQVRFQVHHKKYRKSEELWESTFELVKEGGQWKIWSTPGRKIR